MGEGEEEESWATDVRASSSSVSGDVPGFGKRACYVMVGDSDHSQEQHTGRTTPYTCIFITTIVFSTFNLRNVYLETCSG